MRSKKLFTTGSIVSMVIMFTSLMFGFVEDSYHYRSGSYSYYSGYRKGYSYFTSFADYGEEYFLPLFALTILYISFSIVAIALYNKRIKAINIINLILTSIVYMFALIVAFVAIDYGNTTFAAMLLSAAVGVAFPFHLIVDIFALIAQKYKTTPAQPAYTYQAPVYAPPVAPAPTAPVAPVAPAPTAPVAPVAPAANSDAIETLRQLKGLYEAGVLTEEEYNAKRQQYVSKI